MRNWVIGSTVAVLIGAVAIVSAVRGSGGNYELAYAEVDQGPLIMSVETLGSVEPLTTVTVGCETTGKILEMSVDFDDPVKRDQIICRIDPEVVDAQHAQSVAELARARSAVVEAEIREREQNANLPIATRQAEGRLKEARAALLADEYNWTRVDRLYQEENATEAEWTMAKASHERAQATVMMAEAAYEQAKLNETFLPQLTRQLVDQARAAEKLAQARFEQTQAQVDRCEIRSPIDGIVLQRFMEVGMTVNPTFTTPPLFLLAPSLERMRVLAKVSESDIVHIDIDQPARFTVEGKQRVEFSGRILHKRNQPEVLQGVTTYTVILEVENDERRTLLPGMSVNVEIECVNRPKALRIANKALRFRPPLTLEERQDLVDAVAWPDAPLGQDGRPELYSKKAHLWKFDEKSRAWRAVPVWVGVTDNVMTEILSGASAGDQFVREYIDKSGSSFSLKEAMRLAQPDNRTL